MDPIEITMKTMGHTTPGQPQGWGYEFQIKSAGRSHSIPIIVSDECPDDERENAAIRVFQDWAANLVQEAAKL